ncbi:hypothetical protein LTR85_006181 [Meristemomyces frigidus]|nr:hypothetical protein LTR85_006181 [Meristemomyces frigidus]
MFGRRVAVLLRFPPPARLPAASPFQGQHDVPARTLLCQSRRTYATPGRPRKAVGEPSRPVKRAVKRSAAAATDPDSPAKEKNEAKKQKAAKKEKAARKPAVKKATPRKVLTEEQKAAKTAELDKSETRDLKKAALQPPKKGTHLNAYLVFSGEKGKDLKGLGDGLASYRQKVVEHGKALGAQWKEMSAADIEHYNHLCHTSKEAAQAEYKRWVESHTPEQIQAANRARTTLRRKSKAVETGKRKIGQWPAIHDERAVKRPLSAFAQFTTNRHASGDFKNITLPERSKLIAQEWKALSENEKDKYKALQAEDSKRYVDEYSNAYGHTPPFHNDAHPPQLEAAAAAA